MDKKISVDDTDEEHKNGPVFIAKTAESEEKL
jgi:hypothetical protein